MAGWSHAPRAVGVVARICVCIGVGGALALSLFLASSSASAQSALLDALTTRVTLAHPTGAATQVTTAQIIRSGDTVATDQTGRAVVTYADGSTALLEENSALTIEFVQTNAGDYVVRMRQSLGRVWYAVTRAVTLGSRYEVRSAGMASVIRAGSDSYVSVTPSGETTVVTISGTVETTAGGVNVSVPAGSSTTVSASGATPHPNTPAPSTPAPTLIVRAAPAGTPAPSATSAYQPPLLTVPTLPVMSATPIQPSPKPTVLFPISTPTPKPAPTPIANQGDQSGHHHDDPVRTTPKATTRP